MNKLDVVKSHKQPAYKTLHGVHVRVTTNAHLIADNKMCLSISNSGVQSTGIAIDVKMYDTLRAALEDYRVVEYMNTLRGK